MPAFDKEALVAISGRPGPLQKIKLGGTGDVTKTNVLWDVPRAKGSRDVASPLLVDGVVYLGDRTGQLTGIDWKTGATLFKERSGPGGPGAKGGGVEFVASPVLVRGKVMYVRVDGVTFLLEPGRTFKVAGKNVLSDGTEFRASPVVVDGRLYLRSQKHLFCVGEKQ
jgi:outer membrane protein assembly factor BamB